jgi:hypothetical protein
MKCATCLTSLSVIEYLINCCRKNKLNYQVIMLYYRLNNLKNMLILILILLMITMFSIDEINRYK